MLKLKTSYSLLSQWEMGNVSGAIDSYLGRVQSKPEYFAQGLASHKEMEDSINKRKKIPHFENFTLLDPKAEARVLVPYNELCDLKAKIDCIDGKTLYEYKTGETSVLEFANSKQCPFYFLIMQLSGVLMDGAYVLHHNQHNNENDWVYIWNSEELMEEARNYIDTLVPDIHSYFLEKGILRMRAKLEVEWAAEKQKLNGTNTE